MSSVHSCGIWQVTWFDIASKDFSREMFQSDEKENNFNHQAY